MVTVSKMLIF